MVAAKQWANTEWDLVSKSDGSYHNHKHISYLISQIANRTATNHINQRHSRREMFWHQENRK